MRLLVEQLCSLAESLVTRSEREAGTDTKEVIDFDRQTRKLRCLPGDPHQSLTLAHITTSLRSWHSLLRETTNYEEGIVLAREGLELYPLEHPSRRIVLAIIALWLSTWHGRASGLGSVILEQEVLKHHTQSSSGCRLALRKLASRLLTRYEQFGRIADLSDMISFNREALGLYPQGHPDRGICLNDLTIDLVARFRQLGTMTDLDDATVFGREALGLYPQGYHGRSASLSNLGMCLAIRYEQLGTMADLDEAIVFGRESLELCPHGHPDRSTSLNNLGLQLLNRYNQLGAMADLDEAIFLTRESLELHPKGHPRHSMSLSNLALHLAVRHSQLGAMTDLDEAIVLDRESLKLCPKGHPDRSASLSNLAVRLSARYDQLGEIADLDEAIVLDRESLTLRPKGHPNRSMSLSNLAHYLSTRYNQLGGMTDLDEAIVLDRESLELYPQGHPNRSTSLNNLAALFSIRYKQLGVMADLNEAIVLARESLRLHPKGHPKHSISLGNLALHLATRYDQLRAIVDLEEAIVLDRESLELRPKGHPDRFVSLNNFALHLSTRYDQLGEMADLDEAIALARESLELCPKGSPNHSMSLNNLALHLSTRYEQLGAMADLDEAIVLGRESVDFTPPGHIHRSGRLENLSCNFYTRFMQFKQVDDKEALFGLYTQLADTPQQVSLTDLSATRAWIRVAEEFQHPSILLAYETSLQFLIHHLAALPSLPQHITILKERSSSLAMDAFSACLRRDACVRAVELLEQGRSIFWSQLSRLRLPLDDVVSSGPTGRLLADEFTQVASLIRITLDSPGLDQHERLCHLYLKMQRIINDVRELPGFSRFLLPPLFSDLQHAACKGPVIIVNASQYSCDALVILFNQDPVHIPLQITQESVRDLSVALHASTERAKRADVTRQLGSLLRNLWNQVVSPIVDFLVTTLPLHSRIWWCPTAEFSALPLHAAGPYRKGERNLGDLYISSYTSTLSALIRARRPAPPDTAGREKHFIAIGQANAIGHHQLLSVSTELANIGQRVSGLARFAQIEGPDCCISRVTEELARTEWTHLACHGLPNRTRPFESAFALHDGPFTIERIMRCEPKNPQFAYLSACHTTVGDEESPDEVIHLASAMQFAGFCSVIGTMWAVDDAETNKITSTFYEHMVDDSGCLDHTRAAFALHKTMRLLKLPLDQRILYIHLGA